MKTMTDTPDFEKTLAELDALVQRMEAGELPLAQAMAEFERGIQLTRQCQAHLETARAQVAALLDEDGVSPESNETSD
ncbi:MAG TPA: exodeoxyribonuclease VII small subunit [Wenzhouxiangella sp.]